MTCTFGIDFGTSTTEIAIYDGLRTQLARGWDGSPILPSVVAFLPNLNVEVGRAAKVRSGIDPKNTLHSVKRIIGLPLRAQAVQQFRSAYGFEMQEGPDGLPRFITRAGPQSAGDVAWTILTHILTYPVFETVKPDKVAVTVPSAFAPRQRNEIVAAARRAGFPHVEVLDEPFAAVFPYLSNEGKERFVAVYDLGGGTFDFAVLKLHGLTHWLLASGGDAYLGGNDIDLRLAGWVAEEVLGAHRQDLRSSPSVFQRLLLAAEEVKISLSEVTQTILELDKIDPSLAGQTLIVTRTQLDRLCEDLVRRTFGTCDEVLAKAKVPAHAISDVILVGGVTRMPSVQRALLAYFGREPLASVPPDEVVATGAAMAAALLAGDREVLGR